MATRVLDGHLVVGHVASGRWPVACGTYSICGTRIHLRLQFNAWKSFVYSYISGEGPVRLGSPSHKVQIPLSPLPSFPSK